jgi:eukaryotic-like serine/threonine-protein kinase
VVRVTRTGAFTKTSVVESRSTGARAIEKRLVTRLLGDAEARGWLLEEAKILGLLAGRGAPRLLAEGEDREGPWLLMEHGEMPSLAERMRSWSPDDGDRAAFVDRAVPVVFAALAEVHAAEDASGPLGVVHGDLSPDNLLVSDDAARALVIDFGLARYRDSAALVPGAFRGTARYVAPEVARGDAASPTSDRFALAMTLLHAASGEAPRDGGSLASMIVMAGTEPALSYAERASRGLSKASAAFLLRCVAEAPPP